MPFFPLLLPRLTEVIFSQRVSDAMDVDNELDYKNMVQKIIDAGDPSGVTKILVDMKSVEKLPSYQAGNGDSEDADSDASDNHQVFFLFFSQSVSNVFDKTQSSKTTSDLDTRLAQWRIKLTKLYTNEHDEGLTYIRASGAMWLTPAMVLDWARALVCISQIVTAPKISN